MSRETDLAWLAGIIDGEGAVKIRYTYYNRRGEVVDRRKPSAEIVVGMTCKETVDRCREIAGCGSQLRREFKNRKKPCFFWGVYGDNARNLSRLLLPYSVTKKEKLEEVIAHDTENG